MPPRIIIRTIEDLQRAPRLSNGSYNLAGSDLEGAVLHGAHLEGANLRGANLTGTDFQNAYLTNANLTGAILTGATNFTGADVTGIRGGPNIVNIIRRARGEIFRHEQERRQRNTLPPVLPTISFEPWVSDEDCVGQMDPISTEPIPSGRGFKMENNNITCYDVKSLGDMMLYYRSSGLTTPLKSPLTREEFSEKDIKRINNYIRSNPIGGKKRKTYKKRKIKKITRKRRYKKFL